MPLIISLCFFGLVAMGLILHAVEAIFAAAGFLLGAYMVYADSLQKLAKKPSHNLVALTRRYANEIKNGRTTQDIYDHYLTEVQELKVEMETGGLGADGVVGESIDIITCLLDLIIIHSPDLTDDQIMAIAVRKLDKWKRHYSNALVRDRANER